MSTLANIEENFFYQSSTMETSSQLTIENKLIVSLYTRCDKLESLAAKLISQMNNNLLNEEQITINLNSL